MDINEEVIKSIRERITVGMPAVVAIREVADMLKTEVSRVANIWYEYLKG